MSACIRAACTFSALVLVATAAALAADKESDEGWVTIFDGTSLEGWKIGENESTWKLKDGMLVANGNRSHVFYMGSDEPFVNFELKVDVMTEPNSNGGIFFHTQFQEEGWPKQGFETQVNNTYAKDPRKTGSLYGIVDVTEQHIPDKTWWTQHVIVNGPKVTIKLNDKILVEYEEPAGQQAASDDFERRLGSGTFALQGHDPGSTVYYKNIRVKRLPAQK